MKYLSFFALILLQLSAFAQTEPTKSKVGYFKKNNYFDGAISAGASEGAIALGWNHYHLVGKKGKFKIGYGARFSSYVGKNKNYTTAPAKVTSRQTGPQVLFSETYDESIDTVRFSSPQVNMLNITINLEYNIYKKFDIGFNIDAVGLSFGGKRDGELISSIKPESLSSVQSAKPTPYNVLLVSDNDIGSLNSELFVRYWLNDQLGLKAGATYIFTEYTTDKKLLFDNDRFRNKAIMFMLGVTYCPFKSSIFIFAYRFAKDYKKEKQTNHLHLEQIS